MNNLIAEHGSFRDSHGHIYYAQERVFRTVTTAGRDDFDYVRSTPLIAQLTASEWLLPEQPADKKQFPELPDSTYYLLEHPKLPFISYPYEWPFGALKAAALLQLDIQQQALEYGITMADASAYNIQFQGSQPIFIDHLSFRRYQEGALWLGHRQFCEQFLNPLLFYAKLNVPYHSWYRGQPEGIPSKTLSCLLRWPHKWSSRIFIHVILPNLLQATSTAETAATLTKLHFSSARLKKLLCKSRHWIATLKLNDHQTTWSDYQTSHYSDSGLDVKKSAVTEFIAATQPSLVWDLGCNIGLFSQLALQAGAKTVIGFDNDHGALEQAFQIAYQKKSRFLPLYLDIINPSPQQGFAQMERKGLIERAPANALLALALIHHLAIAHNIPLPQLCKWLTKLARYGLVEFIAKEDAKVQALLSLRQDIFTEYTLENFLHCLTQHAKVIKIIPIPNSYRHLIWYEVL